MPVGGRIEGGGLGAWEVVYSVDLTKEASSASLDSDDTISIAGVTWTAKNGADSVYCDDLKIVNGTGLDFSFGAGNTDSDQHLTTNTCPRLEAAASDLVSGLSYGDTVAFQVLAESGGLNDDWQAYGLTLSTGGSTSDDWITNRTLYYTGYTGYDVGNDVLKGDSGRYLPAAGLSAEPGFRELVWYVGSSGIVAGAEEDPTLLAPLTCSQMEVYGVVADAAAGAPGTSPALDLTTSNATLQLVSLYRDDVVGAGRASFSTTFTTLRVLRRRT